MNQKVNASQQKTLPAMRDNATTGGYKRVFLQQPVK